MQLTKIQKATLEKMEQGKWYSAYDLQVRIVTLEALLRKGLVKRSELRAGDMFFPTVNIKWMKEETTTQ